MSSPAYEQAAERNVRLASFDPRIKRATEKQATRRRKVPSVSVEETLIAELNEHQEKLESYVIGYMLFTELANLGISARSVSENVDRRPWDAFRDLRTQLEHIDTKFIKRASWDEEFGEQLQAFEHALAEANGLLQMGLEEGAESTIGQIRSKLNLTLDAMVKHALKVAAGSKAGTEEELKKIGRNVKEIFRKVRRRAELGSSDVIGDDVEANQATLRVKQFEDVPSQGVHGSGFPRIRQEENERGVARQIGSSGVA